MESTGLPYTASPHPLVSRDGLLLATTELSPPGPPLGAVLLLHGYAEHQGRHLPFAAERAAAGLVVRLLDLRGHGRSGGVRGGIGRFADYLDDLGVVRAALATSARELPLFLVGHSLGGLLALQEGLTRPAGLAGLVAASPLLGLGRTVAPPRRLLAGLLARLWPDFSWPLGSAPALLAAPDAGLPPAADDPFCHGRATARWYAETTRAMATVRRAAAALRCPALLLAGADDRLADRAAIQRFATQAAAGLVAVGGEDADVHYESFSGLRHELWQPASAAAAIARRTARDWILRRSRLPISARQGK